MAGRRVLIFGYGPLALALLGAIERLGVEPVAVVVPGNRDGTDVDLVAQQALAKGWELLVQPPQKSVAPFLDKIRTLRPNLLLVCSYSMLLPPELIALAPLGAINLHGGLLPAYRGGHVMNWAIANGEPETGVTLAYMDEGIDTGPIIAEQRFPIEAEDDAVSVREKLKLAGHCLLETWWPAIEAGTAPKVPQDESRARYHRMRTADDGRIDWSASSVTICNLVRALVAPWSGAFGFVAGKKLVVRRARPVDTAGTSAVPGTVTQSDDRGVRIAAGIGAVEVIAAEIEGRSLGGGDLAQVGLTIGVRLG